MQGSVRERERERKSQRLHLLDTLLVSVHADIKPDNMIMVNNVMKVTDLGLAFRVTFPREVSLRQRVRGTLGESVHLQGFSLAWFWSLKITWHRKFSFIERASNRISGQQGYFSMK